MSNDVWEQVYDRLAELVRAAPHDAGLRQHAAHGRARRAASDRAARQGRGRRASRQPRARSIGCDAEQRLKRGELRALVATASLELGIDIGDVDLVCQLGSPRSIAAFLQRVGRSGHPVGGMPKGRLFPLRATSWSNARRCSTACGAANSTRCMIPRAPLDVLAQQIVAEVACREWNEDALFAARAPRVSVSRPDARGVRRGRAHARRRLFDAATAARGAYLHRDAVNGILRGAARRAADRDHFRRRDSRHRRLRRRARAAGACTIGTVNEDFAVESLAGDIFQLGNTSYRILRVERGRVRVEDAQGAAADDSVLARRGAGPQRRAFVRGVAPARGRLGAAR